MIYSGWRNFISKYPNFPVGQVAMCVVLFLITTEHESSEFFDKTSMKENCRFNLAENEFEAFQQKLFKMFSFEQ